MSRCAGVQVCRCAGEKIHSFIFHSFDRLRTSSSSFILLIAILLYVITFGTLATQQHLAYETSALDLGNYDQAMWNAAHGRGLTMSTQPDISTHRMGHHVEPILYLLLPLYWLWPGPLTLLWAQTIALGLAAWPLFLLSARRLNSYWPALAIALAYLLLPATEAVNLFDFHAVALSPLLMLWGLFFLDKALLETGPGNGFWPGYRDAGKQVGKWAGGQGSRGAGGQGWNDTPAHPLTRSPAHLLFLVFIFLALAMATKEDVSLTVMMVGLYLAFWRRRWRVGLTIFVLATLWAAIAWGVVIPAFRSGGGQSVFVAYYGDLGASPLEIALSPLTKPLLVWQKLTRPESLAALGMLTIPFAFINLIGLPVFLLAAPSLAITLLSDNPLQQQLETWHYAAPMLPFVALAAADGLARVSRWAGEQVGRGAGGAGGTRGQGREEVSSLDKPALNLPNGETRTRSGFFTRQEKKLFIIHYSLFIVFLVASLTYHYLRGYSPLSKPFHWPQLTAHHVLGDEIAASIPPEAKVMAQAELIPHLSQREYVSIWRGELSPEVDYIFMDVSHPKFINKENAHANFISSMVFNDQFGMTVTKDGYILLQKGAERKPTQVGFQDFLFADASWQEEASLARFGDFFSLVGIETHLNREAEPQVTLYFHVLKQPEEDYFIRLYRLNEAGEVDGATVFQQPVLVWWPTHLWQSGDVIKVRFNTLPWWSGDGKHQRFSYAVGISSDTGAEDDPWNVSLRLPVEGERVLPDNLVLAQNFYRLAGIAYNE